MKRTATPYSYEHANECETTVQGVKYIVWQDYGLRSTIAQNSKTLNVRAIKKSGYVSNDLAVRKAIASAFNLDSFRK